MDFNRQNNRPAQRVEQTPRPAPQAPAPTPTTTNVTHEQPRYEPRPKKRGLGRKLLPIVLAIALLGGGYALATFLPQSSTNEFSRVATDKHQAVFMANDQVYFGKITAITDTVVIMENIFYLQETPGEEPATGQAAAAPTQQQSKLALAKLGNELHGPEDSMQINRDQVLFWENLKSDSQVTEAIKAYRQ